MTIRQFLPSPELKHIVEYYLYHTESFNSTSFDDLYSTPILECLAFNFNGGDSPKQMQYGEKKFDLVGHVHLFGQPTSPVKMAGKYDDFIVVKFRPLGIWQLTGVSMQHITNGVLNAEDIFGKAIHVLVEQMREMKSSEQKAARLDLFFQEQLRHKDKIKLHPSVNKALALLGQHHGNIDIKALQEQTNTTRKTLERAFGVHLGITPKLYARIIRYNFAKSHIERTAAIDWRKVTYQYGYYDQSHFINEFKFFSGKTPLEYYRNRIAHTDDLAVLLNPGIALNKS